MSNEDLSKLKIDKAGEIYRPRKKRRRLYWVVALFLAAVLGILYAEGVFLAVQPPVSKPTTIALLKKLMGENPIVAEAGKN